MEEEDDAVADPVTFINETPFFILLHHYSRSICVIRLPAASLSHSVLYVINVAAAVSLPFLWSCKCVQNGGA